MSVDEAQARVTGAAAQEPGRNPGGGACGAETHTAASGQTKAEGPSLMEAVVERSNMRLAYRRVVGNKGAPGIDDLTVDEFGDWLRVHWPSVKAALLEGRYMPAAVRAVDIPKPQGGVRTLGIPTVLDRLLQQALLQVLQPIFEPEFSESSYGFRPGRSAHQAVLAAQRYVQEGRRWVVDIDLEKFFDRVNHDILMSRVARQVKDDRVLKLIRRYLEAGLMRDGMAEVRTQGAPQGGPLSPLLANVLLDEVGKELERRGHCFARYADDANVYVRSMQAGQRVMTLLRRCYAKLHLMVNESKSAVGSVFGRKFLGYSLWVGRGGEVKRKVAAKPLVAFKQRIRELTGRSGGRSLPDVVARLRSYMLGWKGYFRLAQTPRVWRTLDEWLRHRLRAIQLKHWKRGPTIYRELLKLGASAPVAKQVAANNRRWWRNSDRLLKSVFTIAYFDRLGVPRLS